jgi:hypothetical protein
VDVSQPEVNPIETENMYHGIDSYRYTSARLRDTARVFSVAQVPSRPPHAHDMRYHRHTGEGAMAECPRRFATEPDRNANVPREVSSPLRVPMLGVGARHQVTTWISGNGRYFRHLGPPWVPSCPAGGARCDRRQYGSKSTASLAPSQRQSDPVYTRRSLEVAREEAEYIPRRRRSPPARQSRKGPVGP